MSTAAAKNKQQPAAPATTGRGAALYITLGMFMLSLGLAWVIAMWGGTNSYIMHQLLLMLLGLCGPLCPTMPALLIWGGAKLLVSSRHRVSARHFFIVLGIYLLALAEYTLVAPGPQNGGVVISYLDFIRQQARIVGYSANGEYAACLHQAYQLHAVGGGGLLGMLIAYPLALVLTRLGAAVLVGALIATLLLLLFRVNLGSLFRSMSAFGETQREKRLQKRQERMEGQAAMNAPIYETNGNQQAAEVTPPAYYRPAPIYDSQAPAPQPQPDEHGFYPVQPDLYEERFPMEETRRPMEEPEWRKPMQPAQSASAEATPAPKKEKSSKLADILSRLRQTGPISKESGPEAPANDKPQVNEKPMQKDAPAKKEAPVRTAAVPLSHTSPPSVQALDDDDDLPWDTAPESVSQSVPSKPAAKPILPKTNEKKAAEPAPPAAVPAPDSWAAQVSQKKAQLDRPARKDEPQQVFTDPAVPLTGERISITPRREKEASPSGRLDGTTKPYVKQTTMDDLMPYQAPPMRLLKEARHVPQADATQEDEQRANVIEGTLRSFGVESEVKQIMHGPSITRFAIQIAPGVKVSKVANTSDNLALELKTQHVRVEAPIQGTNYIGIEVPNSLVSTVSLLEVLDSPEMKSNPSPLLVALGKDIAGSPILCDLSKMPHLLIAGATGSGKSVCINSIVCSLLYRTTPEQVRLIMVDPKQVELSVYNTIPHLLVPVVSDPKKAAGALNWVVQEMLERYGKFSAQNVRNLAGYNKANQGTEKVLPNIVVIIDEMADLMEVCRKDVEESIRRLAALARAAGIYMVLATQRPSVDVITGVIKNNIPSRIAFAVSSGTDSRTIIDINGAEKLMGKGDMLYKPTGISPIRVQGCFVSDEEVNAIAEYIGSHNQTDFDPNIVDHLENTGREVPADEISGGSDEDMGSGEGSFQDLLQKAIEMAVEDGQTSTSMLQRRLRVGYARAGRLIDEMEKRNIISQYEGSKARKTLITREQYKQLMQEQEGE